MLSLKEIPAPNMYVLTIGPDEELYEELENVFVENGWQEIYIVNGLGSLRWGESEFPLSLDLPPVCEPFSVEGPHEIATVAGTVRWQDEQPFVHLHGSFVKGSQHVYGGALNRGCRAYRGVELFLLVTN